MAKLAVQQVDASSSEALKGNSVAVLLGADALSYAQIAAFASWTNLSETTFLLTATATQADYRVRIFTPVEQRNELLGLRPLSVPTRGRVQ